MITGIPVAACVGVADAVMGCGNTMIVETITTTGAVAVIDSVPTLPPLLRLTLPIGTTDGMLPSWKLETADCAVRVASGPVTLGAEVVTGVIEALMLRIGASEGMEPNSRDDTADEPVMEAVGTKTKEVSVAVVSGSAAVVVVE